MHGLLLWGFDVGVVIVLLLLIPQGEAVAPLFAFLIGALLFVACGNKASYQRHTEERHKAHMEKYYAEKK